MSRGRQSIRTLQSYRPVVIFSPNESEMVASIGLIEADRPQSPSAQRNRKFCYSFCPLYPKKSVWSFNRSSTILARKRLCLLTLTTSYPARQVRSCPSEQRGRMRQDVRRQLRTERFHPSPKRPRRAALPRPGAAHNDTPASPARQTGWPSPGCNP